MGNRRKALKLEQLELAVNKKNANDNDNGLLVHETVARQEQAKAST